MKTEELERKRRGVDPNEVSRALQDLQPLSAILLDRRGHEVPLTSAGYVLRFGHAYHLRIESPFPCEQIDHLQIVTPAPFIEVEPAVHEQDDRGRSVHILPFKVKLDLWSTVNRLGMTVFGDELEVWHYFKPNVYRHAEPYFCPIIVRPRWMTVLIAVLAGLLFMVVERLVTNAFVPENAGQHLGDMLHAAVQRSTWWYFLAIALGVWLIVNLVNLLLVYRRSRELRAQFRETYTLVGR
jgi:hypothetical protein